MKLLKYLWKKRVLVAMQSWTTAVSTSGGAAVRCHASPTIHCNFTLRAARNTAARGKGTIFPRASQLVAPHNQPLLTARERPVPATDSISSAVTLTVRLLYRQRTLVEMSTVGYATTNDATTNECYNEHFLLIKSGCYNERGGILSADVARACEWGVGPSRSD